MNRVSSVFLVLMAVVISSACGKNEGNGGDGDAFNTVMEEHWCGPEGSRIYGKIYKPENCQGRIPAVILSHSSSLTHEAMAGYAESIAGKGYATYCFDFRGGSKESLSDGSEDEMTLFTEIEDLKTVYAEMTSLDYVDAAAIYLMGSSLGGVVSALAAEEMPAKVAGLILFYPAFNISSLVDRFSSFPGAATAFTESLKDYDIMEHIGGYPGPVIIVQGTSDIIVPSSVAQEAAARYDDVELHLIEGANHGFNAANLGSFGSYLSGNYDEKVMPIVYAWLETH
ncbi:MAG: alpha/beta hydrolase family protein [Candidatus Cryptobacteroides sp.]